MRHSVSHMRLVGPLPSALSSPFQWEPHHVPYSHSSSWPKPQEVYVPEVGSPSILGLRGKPLASMLPASIHQPIVEGIGEMGVVYVHER